jgi:hypothetical protein
LIIGEYLLKKESAQSPLGHEQVLWGLHTNSSDLLSLGMKLTNQFVDTGQERLVHLMLPAELVLEIPSLVDLSLGSLQDLVFSLQVFDDFLQKEVG